MDRRFAIGIIAVLAAVIIGAGAYQLGIAQATQMAAQTAGTTSEAMRYGWGYGHGVGFGFLGLLFPLLFIFLLIGLVRAAFGGPRWGGPGGWNGGPRTMFEEWHRDAHVDRPRTDGGNASRA